MDGTVLSLVCLTSRTPSALASDLRLAGYTVWGALTASEVLSLCERHDIDAVVIAPDVEDADIPQVKKRRITLTLKQGATAKDVIWELAQFFPPLRAPIFSKKSEAVSSGGYPDLREAERPPLSVDALLST
ncbi:MAG: hypothetical protein ABSD88_14600 [Candidatus Korobacteraceae bacterium]